MAANLMDVVARGIGEVRVSGVVDEQTVTLGGMGEYDAQDLQSRTANVRVDASGSATVRVSDLLVAHLTSSGSVYYIGDPAVDATITGSGRLVQLDTGTLPQLWLLPQPLLQPVVIWIPEYGLKVLSGSPQG